ncbi:glycosyltransferase family 2 protein [Leptothoe spongobia]|uniref:Glycosyltransferase family 2 protein n=1 Tax=Leptothoe spongobia TAU-MAC 1115 TaxID=1967444 RepID=A0A947GKS5_9CYAN|nr:glycosyltransferase family 2 protein [Leptothoe spongobia]MBT9316767.1 glycosyltransferase family 2 protein [Leptothoe spongobia TAU-MAC 1115]
MENHIKLAEYLSQRQIELLERQRQIDKDFDESSQIRHFWQRKKIETSLYRSKDRKYQKWLLKNCPSQYDLDSQRKDIDELNYKPTISLIMPTFKTPIAYLKQTIDSVVSQTYPYWELCIADDCSNDAEIEKTLLSYEQSDNRIKVLFREVNGHISNASNSALTMAQGDFVGLLDHDDLLALNALYEVVVLLNKHPDADMIYSDEDKVEEDGSLSAPFFKTDWAPDSLLSRMYTSHFGVYRRSLVEKINGFRPGYEGAQDYDFVLRLTELTEKIFHIPKVLYHWRAHEGSTARSIASKSYATDAACRAIEDALDRRDEPGQVLPIAGGHHIVRYHIKEAGKVTIIIPTRDLGDTLNTCLSSIFDKTTYQNYEVLLIDNGSTEKRAIDVIDYWLSKYPKKLRCKQLNIPFNYSKINNYAVSHSHGDYLLFLNNDTEIITPDWIEAMVEQAQRPSIGAVGVKLLYPDNTIQHAGVMCLSGGVAGHSHKHFKRNDHGYFNQIQTINNYAAVTAACLMCRRTCFEDVNGFNEKIQVAFNDVDLCFKFLDAGYRNIYVPHVEIYHYESKSRGYEDNPQKRERFASEVHYMKDTWNRIISNDAYYNPNLSPCKEDYSLNI